MSNDWYAVINDRTIGDDHSTAEGAARAYYENDVWQEHVDVGEPMPTTVVVMEGVPPTHAEYARGYGSWIAEQIAERMVEFCEDYAEDDADTVEKGGESLEAVLAPAIEAWLKMRVSQFSYFFLRNERTFTHAELYPERAL